MTFQLYPTTSGHERVAENQGQSGGSARPTTFGIEIETVLAFHQNRLQAVLEEYYGGAPRIVKTFPDIVHTDYFLNEAALSHQCRNIYPSWALQVPIGSDKDQSLQVVGDKSTTIIGRPGKIRGYLAEPLIVARDAMGSTRIPIDIKAQIRRHGNTVRLSNGGKGKDVLLRARSADYQRWTLTTDHTLIGLLDCQLIDAIGKGVLQYRTSIDTSYVAQEKQWDSAGLELISPVFKYSKKEHAFTDVAKCLTRISSSPTLKLLPSKWASLQVHIGLDYQETERSPLSTIQHLAFFLICHEDLLSRLHPRSRCGLPLKRMAGAAGIEMVDTTFDSGEDEYEEEDTTEVLELTPAEIAAQDEEYKIENDERVLAVEEEYTGYNTTNSNARYFCEVTASAYPPTREHVAACVFDSEITLTRLISLLQKPSTNTQDAAKGHRFRGYMYNFDNIMTTYLKDSDAWKTGKPTIEFRQHACSIDAEEIRRWVELCYAIVSFAHRMAQKGAASECDGWTEEVERYGVLSEWPCLNMERLLSEEYLNVDGGDAEYWSERYERYKDDRPSVEEIDHDAF